jgi:hypothetical protein
MRLWTIHPSYLDTKGLIAAWREALLAQKVLSGGTRGYRCHPQLLRFQMQPEPMAAIGTFLGALADEAKTRRYRFDTSKILKLGSKLKILETNGQLLYEWDHLRTKLKMRAPAMARQFESITLPDPHPLFVIVPGEIKEWEKR